MILADTDVLIDYLAGIQPMKDQIAAYAEADQLQISAISCFELLSGSAEGKRARAIRRLAAELRRKLGRIGRPIGMGDSLTAGIALVHNLPLFTRNTKHFERVPDLKLIATNFN